MITDPIGTVMQTIIGTGPTATAVNFDMLGFGPGSKTTRKTVIPATWLAYVASCVGSIEHTTTKAGRRRSVIRFDAKGVADSSVLQSSASAYLVVDQVDNPPDIYTKLAVDAALSALLNFFVTSKVGATNASVFTASLDDFMRGEP